MTIHHRPRPEAAMPIVFDTANNNPWLTPEEFERPDFSSYEYIDRMSGMVCYNSSFSIRTAINGFLRMDSGQPVQSKGKET
jgi:hypothetical protein